MQVRLGGKDTEIKEGITLQELIDSKPLPGRILVELNGNLIKSEQWGQTLLKAGDEIEMVRLVVGG